MISQNTGIIVQARMGSSRLPGKVLKEVLDRPLLDFQWERLSKIPQVDQLILATTEHPQDDPIVAFAKDRGISYFRGSEDDVLDRYWKAAKKFNLDTIVRVTADCPIIDPEVSSQVIQKFLDGGFDYVSNTISRTYPRGLDTEVFSYKNLELAHQNAKKDAQREHVTPFFYQNPEEFKIAQVEDKHDHHTLRWTVDTSEDFELIQLILEKLYPHKPDFRMRDVLDLLEAHPQLLKINSHIEQKKLQ